MNGRLVFLSSLDRNGRLFRICLGVFSSLDPRQWSAERIIHSLDVLHYDCLVYTDNESLVAAVAFNPDREENIAKAFLVFTGSLYREKGMGKFIVAQFLRWAFDNGFVGAQVGLGNDDAVVAILKSLKKKQDEFELSFADINPETGGIIFKKGSK